MKRGRLFLVPNHLGGPVADVLPANLVHRIQHIRYFIVEEIRSARRLLKAIGYETPFEEVVFELLNEHTSAESLDKLIAPIAKGSDAALISEAGLPAVADPGSDLVRKAHALGVQVIPVSGPSSILMALMSSGLNGQNFAFTGYLPRENADRQKRLRELEQLNIRTGQTQLFMDAPYRNDQVWQSAMECLKNDTLITIAADISTDREFIMTKTVGQWKDQRPPSLNKRPVMFALGR
ncbi:MAG: hypothetical protein RL220_461 [Bacteroidota bacterium]|jgi:16S rRNA (cytidine1402-2'-O)-methyltransferase